MMFIVVDDVGVVVVVVGGGVVLQLAERHAPIIPDSRHRDGRARCAQPQGLGSRRA